MGLIANIQLNCEQVTYLSEKKIAGVLTWSEWIGLRIHLRYCVLCRLFVEQSEILSNAAKLLSKKTDSAQPLFTLDPKRKQEMSVQIAHEIQ